MVPRRERIGHGAERASPMAHGVLLLWRGLAERAPELVAHEERIVAEPALPARRLEDLAAAKPSKTSGTAAGSRSSTSTQR